MKTSFKLILVMAVISLASCTKKQTAQELLKDGKMRDEIMNAICNDSSLTTEMINHMSTTGASEKMLPMSCNMLGKIMTSDIMKKDTAMQATVMTSMLHLMEKDSVLCDKTCTEMEHNVSIKRVLQKKTNQ